jgi:hypothetical protein
VILFPVIWEGGGSRSGAGVEATRTINGSVPEPVAGPTHCSHISIDKIELATSVL